MLAELGAVARPLRTAVLCLTPVLVACAESANAKVEAGVAGACLTIVFTWHDDQ